MEKKIKRDSIIFAHIQTVNHKWVKGQMKKLGFSHKKGKSEFLDNLITTLRTKALVAVLLLTVLSCATIPPPHVAGPPHQPRYQYIWDEDNRIMATIDMKDGSIDYKASQDDVVKKLLKAIGLKLPAKAETKEMPKHQK